MATNKQFIKQVTATDVTSLEVTNIFSDAYENYYCVMDFTRSGSSADQANLLTFIDSTDTEVTSGYGYASLQMNYGSSSGSERTDNSHSDITWLSYDIEGYVDFYVYNPFSSSRETFVNGFGNGHNRGFISTSHLNATTSLTGLKFTFNGTGQYDKIIVNVYGVK